nr:hypothetical protein [Tanacetum cinerariifolium]
MEDPNLTMEEYIELEAEKALRRGQTFNWETTTYEKVRYCEDINYFKDFKTDFPAIVFDDPLATDHKILSEPTVSPLDDNGINFKLSFDESDDEAYTITYDINSFSYKLIFVNDLKLDSKNDDNKVNISSKDVVIEQSDSGIDDVPLGGEVDELMVDPEFDEMDDNDDDDDVWDENDEWLMAPVMPSRATVTFSSTYEMDNLEYRHGVLMRKMEEFSDVEVADSIAIGEIHPRVATVEEQVAKMDEGRAWLAPRLKMWNGEDFSYIKWQKIRSSKRMVTSISILEKQLQDVPVIFDFLEVFPNDLPGLPPPRQV